MEILIKNFISYLFEYGMVGTKTLKNILASYEAYKNLITNSQILESDCKLKIILVEYFKNITGCISKENYVNEEYQDTSTHGNSLELLCQDIVDRYKENKRIEKNNKIKNLLKIYKFSSQLNLYKSLKKFKDNTVMIKRTFGNINRLNTSVCSKSMSRNESKSDMGTSSSNKFHFRHCNSSTNLLNKREIDDIENCTFHPNSGKLRYRKPDENLFARLHAESKFWQEKKSFQLSLKEKEEEKKYLYDPNFYKSNNNYEYNLPYKFLERQSIHQKINKDMMNDMKKKKDEKMLEECTFKPKLFRANSCGNFEVSNENFITNLNNKNESEDEPLPLSSKKVPRFEKLYENGLKKFKQKSLECSPYHDQLKTNKFPDANKLNSLYNDYKKKNSRMREMLKNLDKENGVTFKPKLISGKKYKVESTFEERNLTYRDKAQNSSIIFKDKTSINNNYNNTNKISKKEIETSRRSNFIINKLNPDMEKENKLNPFNNLANQIPTNYNTSSNCKNLIPKNYKVKFTTSSKNPIENRLIDLNESKRESSQKSSKENIFFTLNQTGEFTEKCDEKNGKNSATIQKNNITRGKIIFNGEKIENFNNLTLDNTQNRVFNNSNIPNGKTENFSNENCIKKENHKRFRSITLQNLLDNKYV